MTRAERLLALIALLRRSRYAVSAQTLANKLAVTPRTIYRDIEVLRAQGAVIEGEAGVGFVFKDDFSLPPLMFDQEELAALVLGMRWVIAYGDPLLSENAKKVLGKIKTVLPSVLAHELRTQNLYPIAAKVQCNDDEAMILMVIRESIRQRCKVYIEYEDGKGGISERIISPLIIGYFPDSRLVAAWCDLRQAFRHFRTDRVRTSTRLDMPFDRTYHELMQAWLMVEGVEFDRFNWEITTDKN